MSVKIYLSPAAHGNDNPCSYDRANCGENVHCNLYMDELEPILKACGFDVRRNPKERTGGRLHEAIGEANAWGADLYYVCHTNAGGGAYSKLMVYDQGIGYTYAEKIKAQQHEIYTNPIKITVEPQWAEISQTKMPCVYHEMVFHDNIDEITYFHNHFREFAICVAKGICDCFGVTFINPYDQEPSVPTSPAGTTEAATSKPSNWNQHGPNPTLVWNYQYDPAIADLQSILNGKGKSLAVDGKAGNDTYGAVKEYTINKGDKGPLTKWVQQRLTSVGCPCGAFDGIAGNKTMAAIASFQAYYGLGEGYLGGTDWYYLIR